jgi:tetratricopeptide (TPR) repeat protein
MSKITIVKCLEYLDQLVFQFYQQGNVNSATEIAEQALILASSIYPDNHSDLAGTTNNLALCYKSQGRLDEAEYLYVKALNICRQLFSNCDSLELATGINNLALLYKSQGKFNEAEPLLEEGLGVCRRLFPNQNHHYLATSINNLALLYDSQDKLDEAESLYKEALSMRRKYTPEIPFSAITLSWLPDTSQ